MQQQNRLCIGVLLGVFLLIGWQGQARGAEVTEQVKQTVDKVIAVLKNPALEGEQHTAERLEALRDIVGKQFDFQEMAKRSLARHWAKRSPEEQKEFVEVFSDLLEASYVNTLESYTDEQILYSDESVDGNYAEVKTKVVTDKNEIPIDYRLLKERDQWMVYDVVIEGVSLVNNYRSQFNKIIGQSSYQDLVQKLKTKVEEGSVKPPVK